LRRLPGSSGRLARYFFTGGAAAVVDIGGFGLLSSLRIPIVIAAGSSFLLAAIVNFLLTSRWVFRTEARFRDFFIFLMGTILGLMLNVTLTAAGVIYLTLPRTAAKTIAIGATFLLNFWVNARVVFRNQCL
jgi:putative flippase GtrA